MVAAVDAATVTSAHGNPTYVRNVAYKLYFWTSDGNASSPASVALAAWIDALNSIQPTTKQISVEPMGQHPANISVSSADFSQCGPGALACYKRLDPLDHRVGYLETPPGGAWNTTGTFGGVPEREYALQGIVLHEVGHFMGVNGHVTITCPPTNASWPGVPLMASYQACTTYSPVIDRDDLSPFDAAVDGGWLATTYNSEWCPDDRWDLGQKVSKDDPPPLDGVCSREAAEIASIRLEAGSASWSVLYEHGVQHYSCELSTDGMTWIRVGPELPAGMGEYTVSFPAGHWSHARIVENDLSGPRRVLFASEIGSEDSPPTFTLSRELLLERLRLLEERNAGLGHQSALVNERAVIYAPSEFISDLETYVASYWEIYWGYDVDVVNVDNWQATSFALRDESDADIATRAALGTKYFHLVGDANDYEVYWGAEYQNYWLNDWEALRVARIASFQDDMGYFPDLSWRDVIPTYYVADTEPYEENMAWWQPYFETDLPYADVDDDGIPDVVVTRWPVTDSVEVLAMAAKMQDYNGGVATSSPKVLHLKKIGISPLSDPDQVQQTFLGMNSALPPGSSTVILDNLPAIPHPADYAPTWNTLLPELVTVTATGSTPRWVGEILVSRDEGYTALVPNAFTVVIGPTCGTASFAITEPTFEVSAGNHVLLHPTNEGYLYRSDAGAVAWVGATEGTWTAGNAALAGTVVSEITSEPDRPLAESFLLAQRSVLLSAQGDPQVTATASSYVFLGDPFSRFRATPIPVGMDPTTSPRRNEQLRVFPNPGNPRVTVSFSHAVAEPVVVTVLDSRGRRVRRLFSGHLAEGNHSWTWDGRDEWSRSVASGLYYVSAAADGRRVTRKVVLVR